MAMLPHFNGGRRGSGDTFDPYAMDLWDPFSLFRDSNRHHGALSTPNSNAYTIANAHIDWKETPAAHIFMADLPGMKKEEVKVEVDEDGVLQISGERGRSEEVTGDRWHRVERSSGKFMRRFRLPENVKVDEIKACMEHGVLTVNVPKVEAKNRSVKAIEISGGI